MDLRAFLDEHPVENDLILAEIIESDGRVRGRFSRPITLDRYFNAIGDLRDRADALDAAIDLALRGASSKSNADSDAITRLIEQYPDLAAEIHDAAMLNNALLSTTGLRKRVTTTAAYRLPCDFGPTLEDGRPRYRLEELLGAGAFGEVYLATDRHLSDADHEARVAIKILSPRHDDPFDRRQLAEEAMKARRINHPFVVRVFDRGTTEQDEDFIVYELVERGSLQHWLRKKRLPIDPREAAALMAKIARGLQAAHAAGLIHCDLKPGNIMMTPDGDPKISDFGIAIRAGEQLHRRAATGTEFDSAPIGNQAFISPEQYRREDGSLTVASDLYALGGILYYLLTGNLPNGQTPEEIERNHDRTNGRTSPPSVRATDRTIDSDLDRTCQRAMAIDPADRQTSAGALADDLEAWLAHEPIHWLKPSLPRIISLWAQRRPAIAAMMAILLTLLFSGAIGAQHLIAQRLQANISYGETASQLERIVEGGRNRSQQIHDLSLTEPFVSGYTGYLQHWEYVLGPEIMADPELRYRMLIAKEALLRTYLARMKQLGYGHHWTVNIYRSVLAMWLFRRGTNGEVDQELVREAITELDHSLTGLRLIFADDDFVLDDLTALREAMQIELLLSEHANESAFRDRERQQLVAIADAIEAQVKHIMQRDPTHPVRELAGRTLKKLFDPDHLNDPERFARAEEISNLPRADRFFVPGREDR